jgi:hypothetical protein
MPQKGPKYNVEIGGVADMMAASVDYEVCA